MEVFPYPILVHFPIGVLAGFIRFLYLSTALVGLSVAATALVGLTLYVARRHVDAEQPRPRAP